MVVKICEDVFVRTYGAFVYFFRQTDWAELIIDCPNAFAALFKRRVVNLADEIKRISIACKTTSEVVAKDIGELLQPLRDQGWINVAEADCDGEEATQGRLVERVQRTEELTDPRAVLMKHFGNMPTPFELCIDLTRACTERCVHCYVPGFQNVYLPYEMVEKVLSEFAVMGGLKVKLTGGECMLHPDFERIVALARAHDMVISVLSNLTCCDLEKAQAMKDAGVAVVQVSLYGMTPETHEAVTQVKGSQAKTLRGIEILQKAGVPVQIHCPVLKQNVSGIDAVARYGRERGVKTTFDAVMMSRADHGCNESCGLSDAELRQFIGAHEDLPDKLTVCPDADADEAVCEIGTSKICLSAEGKYYPCNGCYGLILGDCRNQTLAEVWNDEPIKRLRALKMRDLSACRVCPNRMLCAPCPSRNFNANGDLTLPDAAMCKAAACRRNIVERRAKEN